VFLRTASARTKALFEKTSSTPGGPRQHANVDLDLEFCRNRRLENAAMIFDLERIAVGGRSSEAENRALINPGVTANDAVGFSGFEEHSRQRIHKFVNSFGGTL